jgi:serine/threonine protein kinase
LGAEYKGSDVESIALGYIQGENLDILIARSKSLHENMIRIYTQQLYNAIGYLHAKNIIHRDIKSANIMVVGNYMVKIIDFGMAKRVSGAYNRQDDSTNSSVVGTLAYMVCALYIRTLTFILSIYKFTAMEFSPILLNKLSVCHLDVFN